MDRTDLSDWLIMARDRDPDVTACPTCEGTGLQPGGTYDPTGVLGGSDMCSNCRGFGY